MKGHSGSKEIEVHLSKSSKIKSHSYSTVISLLNTFQYELYNTISTRTLERNYKMRAFQPHRLYNTLIGFHSFYTRNCIEIDNTHSQYYAENKKSH